MSDDQLQRAYERLVAARGAQPSPDVPPEVIQSLAEGRYHGPDRAAMLERVLSHPATAAELHFFADLARARPKTRVWQSRPWLAAAAAVVLMVAGAGVATRLLLPDRDVVRAQLGDPQLVEPAPNARIGTSTRFVWRSFPDATSYRLELIDADANAAFTTSTRDTVVTLPPSVRVAPGGSYLWWVTAQLADGTARRARPRPARGPAG